MVTQPCPGLVECVEQGELQAPQTRALLAAYVQPLLAAGCDTLILGCTHYPFLKPLLRELVPVGVELIDTGVAVARQLERLLAERELLAGGPAQAARFWSSGEPAALARVLPVLWGEAAAVGALER
ncbi:Glutamate racemase [compost metagenome]